MTDQRTPREEANEENEKAEGVKFIFSLVVLGLAAALIAKNGHGKLRNAAIGNLVAAIVSPFTGIRLSHGHWTSRARWGLVFATSMWLTACVFMFIGAGTTEVDLDKRSLQPDTPGHLNLNLPRGLGDYVKLGVEWAAELESIAYACAIFSLLNL
ncbi:hypothetical protein BHE90_008818 [Fusarium euwallaceae]|uniref:Uncharacterized protein n=2 Tax=Fusarium solani species complex TaxID=232080 RepID=A0A3M2SKC6_9HYPO|nr:hypothetical protein CDV36_002561 [Fusarium kuroshium]RTE76708.1 hypothetical protein BHE90_008818 [Fusarium euwallaceae]